MSEILAILVPWVVTTTVLFVVIHRDEARLPAPLRARAWPVASRRIAVVYFGVVALPVHFARTRRTFVGFLLGLAWGVGLTAVDEGLTWAVDVGMSPAPLAPPQ